VRERDTQTHRDIFDEGAVREDAVLSEEAEVHGVGGITLHQIQNGICIFVQRRCKDHHLCVLQCVAVCCSVLQRVAMCCSVSTMLYECCSVWQYVAACCSVLQSVDNAAKSLTSVCCSDASQHVAVRCSGLTML